MNVGKLKYASEHFRTIDAPVDYNLFFEALRDGTIDAFVSTLQGSLKA